MSAPNLLFLFPDQWRWDWLQRARSAYGDPPVKTPNIDRLAQRGTSFTQCRTNSPVCQPARACLASSMRYHRSSVRKNSQQLDAASTRTIFQQLRDSGYRTACCGKTDLLSHGRATGIDGWSRDIGRLGFTHSSNQGGKGGAILWGRPPNPTELWGHSMQQRGLWQTLSDDWDRRMPGRKAKANLPTHPTPVPSEAHSDGFTAERALAYLNQWPVNSEDPWMMWVNFPGPHEPFDPPAEFAAMYEGVSFPDPSDPIGPEPDNDHQAVRRAYAALCTHIDSWIGRILDRLDERGETDNTLIVFSSDHGEMLGDHGRWYKSIWYEPAVHVPLIVAGPGVEAGQIRDDLVELIDIGPTLLAAAGVEPLPEVDARPLPTHGGQPREVQLMGLDPWSAIFDGRYKLVIERDPPKPPKLFDLETDPLERTDLADHEPEVVDRLRRRHDLEIGQAMVGR